MASDIVNNPSARHIVIFVKSIFSIKLPTINIDIGKAPILIVLTQLMTTGTSAGAGRD